MAATRILRLASGSFLLTVVGCRTLCTQQNVLYFMSMLAAGPQGFCEGHEDPLYWATAGVNQ